MRIVTKYNTGLIFLAGLLFICSCTTSKKLNSHSSSAIRELKFLGEYNLPGGREFKNTWVGGLSGIDYDVKRDLYYMICDDPSSKGPTRFYTAKIKVSEKGIDTVYIVDMTILLNRNGAPYADITKDRLHSADVEAMRYDAKRDELVRSSEGQRFIRGGIEELEDPDIVIMDRVGHYKDSFELPPNMHIQSAEKGPRHNEVFEGLDFDENYSHLFVSLESPIYEDGLRAAGGDSTAWIRILKFNRSLKHCVAQYAYKVDAVPYPPVSPGGSVINGVSDILYVGDNRFVVIERGYSAGRGPSDIRVYLADAKGAEDISSLSLKEQPPKVPLSRKLLVNMDNLGIYIDNIEGVTFGPLLSNGHRTLIFVSDDNFSPKQKSQFLLFEIIP